MIYLQNFGEGDKDLVRKTFIFCRVLIEGYAVIYVEIYIYFILESYIYQKVVTGQILVQKKVMFIMNL